MKTLARYLIRISLLNLLLQPVPLWAQWVTQTLNLQPGWNAVFLEVDPEPRDCDTLFAGLPVESVWTWNRRFSSVQFIQDPETLVPGQQDWLTYLPPTHDGASVRNLFVLQGGRSYLIQLAAHAAPQTLRLKGRPSQRQVEWMSDSLNLVGFHVDPSRPPTFERFFAASANHAGQPVYRLNSAGRWERVLSPASTALSAGQAFWVRCQGPSSFSGPLQVQLEQSSGLDYGRNLIEQTMRIRNTSASARSVRIAQLPSETPPNGSPVLAGAVPLSFYRRDLTNGQTAWIDLSGQATHASLAPGEDWVVRVAVRRADMVPASSGDARYQSLLEVSDDAGSLLRVPVSAYGLGQLSPAGIGGSSHPYSGLWIGQAVIEAVNEPANLSHPDTPMPTAVGFPFRLIIHVDGTGRPRLLSQAAFTASDSARRITSAAFGFASPIAMTASGDFGAHDATVSCVVSNHYDDPLNPFKHRYHPAHDNLDPRFETRLGDRQESYTVIRHLTLRFTAADPFDLALAGWGDNQLGGTYRENITGLHKRPLHIAGKFRLHKVAAASALSP